MFLYVCFVIGTVCASFNWLGLFCPLNSLSMRRVVFLGVCSGYCCVALRALTVAAVQPFFYQVKGTSATRSGIDILPYMLSGVICTCSLRHYA